MNINNFIEELKNINIDVTEEQLNQLEEYYKLLVEWNNKINLTRIIEKEDVYLKHFYDSATINKIINLNDINEFCDFGTGAGFPGMVIKILFPKLNITLVDSLNKRIIFLNVVIEKLNLKNIKTIHSRIEDFAKLNRNKFDLVTARAVAPLNVLLEYSIPMVKINKYFLAMKANINEELEKGNNAIKLLNIELIKREEFKLPYEDSTRNLLLFQKNKETNSKYPRSNNDIKRKPL